MSSEIVIVSGLPRSGTSLMMQMLHHGDLAAVTDRERVADEDNPAGYFEFEPVKKMKQDTTWLADARGKAVKVISQLLFDLPATEHYAILFIERDLAEVLASQDKMLARSGRKGASHAMMRSAFEKHLAKLDGWLQTQPHIRLLRLNYPEVIAQPLAQAERIKSFLGLDLDPEKMAAAVDPSLYRNRVG
ncbi:MAG: sulfotransferase [Bythopirellula sp.]|nr:sulfotransferase [Bythopirellula sp.]